MNTMQLCSMVRLLTDVPTLWLCRGEVGVVRKLWLSPIAAYEVESHTQSQPCPICALPSPEQLEAVAQPITKH